MQIGYWEVHHILHLKINTDIFSPFKRLILYGIILIAMTAFLNLMSTKKKLYTYIGSRTLYVYLLHGLIIGIVRGFEWYPFDNPISLMTYLYLISISGTTSYMHYLQTLFVNGQIQ